MNWRPAVIGVVLLTLAMAAALAIIPAQHAPIGRQTSETAAAVSAAPVLVELFTSQGCSSCPPADAVLARLQARTDVVALSRPVTYWDRLGWRDTLAREANTIQQRAYAARGVGGGGVYTPAAVVNGSAGVVGSQEADLRRLIATARTDPQHRLTANGSSVSSQGIVTGAAELRFVAVANLREVRIGSGENGGRTVRYHNVVLDEASIGCAASAACSATVPPRIANLSGKERIAVVLQRPNNGAVLAARWL